MWKTVLASLLLGLSLSTVSAQGTDNTSVTLTGPWTGALVIGQDSFQMTFNFSRNEAGMQAALISPQMGIYGMPAETVRLENNRLTVRLELLAAEYTGRLRMDDAGSAIEFIDGEWFQEGEMVPIILRPESD